MTDETGAGAVTPAETTDPAGAPEAAEPAQAETDWKGEARKWEQRAKANAAAAARLAEIEDASKTEAQRAAEAQQAAEQRVAEAEARVLRREVALKHRLTQADAALLDAVTDEDDMRALAARLSAPAAAPASGNVAPLAGVTPKSEPGDEESRSFLRDLVGAH